MRLSSKKWGLNIFRLANSGASTEHLSRWIGWMGTKKQLNKLKLLMAAAGWKLAQCLKSGKMKDSGNFIHVPYVCVSHKEGSEES